MTRFKGIAPICGGSESEREIAGGGEPPHSRGAVMSGTCKNRALSVAMATIPVLFAASALVQTKIDAQTSSVAVVSRELLLQSPEAVKKLSLGYDPLLADIYWTRVVQYYGKTVGTDNADFTLLSPLLDLATTLDPDLVVAYHFGAIFLSETGEAGAGRTDLAIRLVKKGIAANPNQWQLGTDLGFLYYWRMKDYPDAAATYLQTSKIANSPPWIKMMAARVSQTGGSLETSRMIWSQIYDSTNDPEMKKLAGDQMQGLKTREDLEQLSAIAEKYKERSGHYPASAEELRGAGMLYGIPVDPAGFAYEIGPDGKARLNSRTPLVIPVEPKTFSAPSN
jgi:hypothetical protein